MYLVHSPFNTGKLSLAENWKVMEQLRAEGLCKSIGVSNYREEDLFAIRDAWTVPPAVNQIEFNPYIAHAPNVQRLLKLCKEHDIKIEAYGPLNSVFRSTDGPLDPVVDKVAKAKGATPGQVLLRWATQYTGGIAVTTSRNSERQKEQLAGVGTVPALTEDEVEAIAEADPQRANGLLQVETRDLLELQLVLSNPFEDLYTAAVPAANSDVSGLLISRDTSEMPVGASDESFWSRLHLGPIRRYRGEGDSIAFLTWRVSAMSRLDPPDRTAARRMSSDAPSLGRKLGDGVDVFEITVLK
ncbi:hypothetical protein EHS25_001718 [Saitozyma podzolica]|uniref:NADP-dependent oxidoreductase domain-containing protein n=1 Tax=Saitozyma podzolica TaxID=1890683 RepID=A0A427YFD6_9TREE|nr:hypothetical protein EHS25_001718 [Saitozyma podzolica]